MRHKEEIINFWDKFSKDHNTKKIMLGQQRRRLIVKHTYKLFKNKVMNSFKEAEILEVGCGEGIFTKYLINEPSIKRLVCTDISSEAVKLCKQKGLPALIADVEDLSFDDNSFDIVCGFEVLHHLDNPKKAINECCRVSRNIVFFNEPNSWNPMRRLMEKFYYPKAQHETSYSIFQCKKWFKNTNFSPNIIPYDFLIPYFSNNYLIKLNVLLDKILNKLPINIIGASLAIIGRHKYDEF